MAQRFTLREHRQALRANPNAFLHDLPRAKRTVISHLRNCGYSLLSVARPPPPIEEYVEAIFDTQARQPFFNVPSELPYCWNSPKDWDKNYIRYEWGHLDSRNQCDAPDNITNLCLQSARCNQHIQTSLNIDEVQDWLQGSPVAHRVSEVMQARDALFTSPRWKDLLASLAVYRPSATVNFF